MSDVASNPNSALNPVSKSPIRKAIFPVAGLGTRFLPATKAAPKEMLPIVDKPLIQYAVEEAVEAGCTELIFVTSHAKRTIEDHFDTNYELESKLAKSDKQELLSIVKNVLPKGVNCYYIRQAEALGLGHAVYCAASLVGNEAVAVLLADDLIDNTSGPGCLSQLVNCHEQTQSSVLGVMPVAQDAVSQYGIVSVESESSDAVMACNGIIEKPSQQEAPSQLAVVGRYILTPAVFHALANGQPDKRGEIQLTDAILQAMQTESVYAYPFAGTRFDCGSKVGYLKAIVHFGLQHHQTKTEFLDYLKELKI